MRHRVEPVRGAAARGVVDVADRRIRSIRNVRRSSRRWSWAARYQRPAWTTSPYGLSSRRVRSPVERAVARPHAQPSPDRLGEEEDGVARDRRAGPRRVVKPSAVSSASTRRRSGSGSTRWIFVERAVDRRLRRSSSPCRRAAMSPRTTTTASSSDEHERRQPVARAHAVAAADAALPLDGDAELLERGDVAAHRARVDREPVGDLAAGRQRPRLEQLEQLEQPGGRRLHAPQSSTDRGRDPPYLRASVHGRHDDGRRTMSETAAGASRRRGTSTSGWAAGSVRNRRLRGGSPAPTTGTSSTRRRRRGRSSTGSATRTSSAPTTTAASSGCRSGSSTRRRSGGRSTGPTAGARVSSIRPVDRRVRRRRRASSRARTSFKGRPILVRFIWSGVTHADAALGAGVLRRRRQDLGDELGDGLHAGGGRAMSVLERAGRRSRVRARREARPPGPEHRARRRVLKWYEIAPADEPVLPRSPTSPGSGSRTPPGSGSSRSAARSAS